MTLYLSPNNHNFCGPLTWLVAYFLLTGGGFADALPEKQHEFIKLFRHCKQSLCNKDLLHQMGRLKRIANFINICVSLFDISFV